MKQFNLQEYLANPSRKVITRDGRDVRIVCTDCKDEFPVVALVYNEEEQKESVECFYENGKYLDIDKHHLDLYFAPIKREGWINLFKGKNGAFSSNFIFETEKRAKEVIGEKHTTYLTTIKIEWEE